MKTKEEIVKILCDELSYIYCHNCANMIDVCEECHRKYMNWQIHPKIAEKLADLILED